MHLDTPQPPNGPDRVATGLAKIGLVLRHQAWRVAEPAGLTPTQSQVLAVIAASQEGWLSVNDIARELAVTQPTASDAIAALVRKRLVKRNRSESDARVVQVRMTEAGRRRARETVEWPDVLLKAVAELDPIEQAVFLKGLMKMIRSLQESGQIPTARMCATCTHFRPHSHPGTDSPHHCAYVDAPLRDTDLRLDCREHTLACDEHRQRLWKLFIEGRPSRDVVSPGALPGGTARTRGAHS